MKLRISVETEDQGEVTCVHFISVTRLLVHLSGENYLEVICLEDTDEVIVLRHDPLAEDGCTPEAVYSAVVGNPDQLFLGSGEFS